MLRIRCAIWPLAGLLLAGPVRAGTYADRLIDYQPGTGFTAGYTNAAAALDEPSRVTPGMFGGPVDPFNPPYLADQLVSLGAGGSLTVEFTLPIRNDPAHPFGLDFLIFGNAGLVITNGDFSGGGITDGSLFGSNPGATRVSVSLDNSLFYPLINPAGAVTVDSWFPTDGIGDFSYPVDRALGQTHFTGKDLAGIRELYRGSGGGTGFDISWARDADNQSVALPAVRFIRVDVLEGKSEIDAFAAIPEPGTGWLLGAGALLLCCRRRRTPLAAPPANDAPRQRPVGNGQSQIANPKSQIGNLTAAIPLWVLVGGALGSTAPAATWTEDFTEDPQPAWEMFGESGLFRWLPEEGQLDVTWDSAQSNSFFFRRLGTVLTRTDDFQLGFDLLLSSVQGGAQTNKPSTFELAVGFLNRSEVAAPDFLRGTGTDPATGPRNVVEFDYFPDTGFGATIAPTIISSNRQFATSFNFPLELAAGTWYRIVLAYTAADQTLRTRVTGQGQDIGPIRDVRLDNDFSDFQVDMLAIVSYSDAGQSPPEFAGSILARGRLDNVSVTVPDLPVTGLRGQWISRAWHAQTASVPGWRYSLERTIDFQVWTTLSAPIAGTGQVLDWTDPEAVQYPLAFYRVKAER